MMVQQTLPRESQFVEAPPLPAINRHSEQHDPLFQPCNPHLRLMEAVRLPNFGREMADQPIFPQPTRNPSRYRRNRRICYTRQYSDWVPLAIGHDHVRDGISQSLRQ